MRWAGAEEGIAILFEDTSHGDGDLALARRRLEAEIPALRGIARRLYRDRADADDLVQDVVEHALRALDRLDPQRNPRAWLITILHHLHIDDCRRRARHRRDVPADELPLAAPEPAAEPAWCQVTTAQLLHAVDALSEELRSTYVLFSLEGRSYDDISERLRIPKSTVGTRLARARAQLKRILTANPMESSA